MINKVLSSISSTNSQRMRDCMERFDEYNSEDPNREADGTPKELLYAQRMSAWLEKLHSEAPEEVHLAVRAQHIGRWKSLRSDYPKGRIGYLKWRQDLGHFHAETAGAIMQDCGYDERTIGRVQAIIRKKQFKSDPLAQLLEDVACLVFLEFYFEPFANKEEADSMINILRRTWTKMSEKGHQAALSIEYTPQCAALIQKALKDT